jgi:hypothetical protein
MTTIIKDKVFQTLEDAQIYLEDLGFTPGSTYRNDNDSGVHTYYYKHGVKGLVRLWENVKANTFEVAQATG